MIHGLNGSGSFSAPSFLPAVMLLLPARTGTTLPSCTVTAVRSGTDAPVLTSTPYRIDRHVHADVYCGAVYIVMGLGPCLVHPEN